MAPACPGIKAVKRIYFWSNYCQWCGNRGVRVSKWSPGNLPGGQTWYFEPFHPSGVG